MQNFGNETGNQVTCVVNQCEFWYNLSGFEVLDGNQTKFPDFTWSFFWILRSIFSLIYKTKFKDSEYNLKVAQICVA